MSALRGLANVVGQVSRVLPAARSVQNAAMMAVMLSTAALAPQHAQAQSLESLWKGANSMFAGDKGSKDGPNRGVGAIVGGLAGNLIGAVTGNSRTMLTTVGAGVGALMSGPMDRLVNKDRERGWFESADPVGDTPMDSGTNALLKKTAIRLAGDRVALDSGRALAADMRAKYEVRNAAGEAGDGEGARVQRVENGVKQMQAQFTARAEQIATAVLRVKESGKSADAAETFVRRLVVDDGKPVELSHLPQQTQSAIANTAQMNLRQLESSAGVAHKAQAPKETASGAKMSFADMKACTELGGVVERNVCRER